MSLWGKILALLNVIAAAGFIYLASADYATRQTWAYAVFRQELAINGLPLQAEDTDFEGVPVVERIHEPTRKELFPTGGPVLTQVEEVGRVRGAVETRINGLTDRDARMAYCARVLEPFARTGSEYERFAAYRTNLASAKALADLKQQFGQAYQDAVRRVRRPPEDSKKRTLREAFDEALLVRRGYADGPFADALFAALRYDAEKAPNAIPTTPFDKAFDEALAAQDEKLRQDTLNLFTDALLTQGRSPEERKHRIAGLLFGMVAGNAEEASPPGAAGLTEDPAFRRFVTVVGVRAAVGSVHDAAGGLAVVAGQVQVQRGREVRLFARRHAVLLDRVRDRARLVETEASQLRRRQELVTAHEEELKKRRRDVEQHVEELAKQRKETAERVATLRDLADRLFKDRVALRQAMQNNQQMEKQIRALEEEGR
jgi:hypothetical protein